MFALDIFTFFHDIIAYMVAARGLLDEILYKFGYKRKLDVKKELPSNLGGQVAIVTGGTRGIGLNVVKVLLAKGCDVLVVSSQTEDKFSQMSKKIYEGIPEKDPDNGVKRGTIKLHSLDLSDMSSVKDFIHHFKKTKSNLNYLICNAGIMFAPRRLTVDGFESHFAVNYLSHCLLITELLPVLLKTACETNTNTRIVSVSSSTHQITRIRFEDLLGEANYSSSQAYAQSKLAQIMFTAKLNDILRDRAKIDNVKTFCLHPGVVLSDLYEHVLLIKLFPFLIPLIKLVTRNTVEGAETTLYAALSSELNNISGEYLEDCTIKAPSKQARNKDNQERLWELTNKLLSPWIETSALDK